MLNNLFAYVSEHLFLHELQGQVVLPFQVSHAVLRLRLTDRVLVVLNQVLAVRNRLRFAERRVEVGDFKSVRLSPASRTMKQ